MEHLRRFDVVLYFYTCQHIVIPTGGWAIFILYRGYTFAHITPARSWYNHLKLLCTYFLTYTRMCNLLFCTMVTHLHTLLWQDLDTIILNFNITIHVFHAFPNVCFVVIVVYSILLQKSISHSWLDHGNEMHNSEWVTCLLSTSAWFHQVSTILYWFWRLLEVKIPPFLTPHMRRKVKFISYCSVLILCQNNTTDHSLLCPTTWNQMQSNSCPLNKYHLITDDI